MQQTDFAPKKNPSRCASLSAFVAAPSIVRAQPRQSPFGFVTGGAIPDSALDRHSLFKRHWAAALAYPSNTIACQQDQLVQLANGAIRLLRRAMPAAV